MEEEVCRAAARPDAAAQAARGRECTAEEDRGGADTGSGDATGRYPAKNLKPGRLRELVRGMCSDCAGGDGALRGACPEGRPNPPSCMGAARAPTLSEAGNLGTRDQAPRVFATLFIHGLRVV